MTDSAHVVDRFLNALQRGRLAEVEALSAGDPIALGYFRASPEAARMLIEHMRRFSMGDGKEIFGRPVRVDPALARGDVIYDAAERIGRASRG